MRVQVPVVAKLKFLNGTANMKLLRFLLLIPLAFLLTGSVTTNILQVVAKKKAGGPAFTYYATAFAGDGDCWIEQDDDGGASDATGGTISFWIDPTGSDTNDFRVIGTASGRVRVGRGRGDDIIEAVFVNASGTEQINLRQNSGILSSITAASGWAWVGICWDNTTTGGNYIYIANSATSWVATDVTLVITEVGGSSAIDWTNSDWAMGALVGDGVSQTMAANISEFWMSQTYYDLSNSANRDIFYNSSTHKPAGDLSAVGSPVFYQAGEGTGFLTNSGSGGDWVSKGGTALTSATAP